MLPIRASRIVHSSRRRALPSLASVRHSRRSAQLSLLSVLLNSPPLVPRSPLAALVLSNRFLPSLASVRHSRRSAQLSLPRARRSPSLVRPNLFNGRVSSLLLVRFSIRLLTRLSSPLLVRPSLQAAPALSSRHLPSERRPPNRIRITLVVRMALLRRPARATTRMLVAVLKRKAPRCL